MPTEIVMDMPALMDTAQLEARLAEAGITAVVYASLVGGDPGVKLTVAAEANLSPAVRQQIRDRVAAFRPRRPKQADALKAAVEALTAAQRNAILARLVAEALQRDPGLARRAGVSLDGDEEAA